MKVINEQQAAELIEDGWTIIPGGFGSCGHPDGLTRAISERFKREGRPRKLGLLFASASGDLDERGMDVLAQSGLVAKAIGGFWGLIPRLGVMARLGEIEAHNWPQGVISQLFRAIAAKKPGVISNVGLNTFVDPDHDGACLNRRGARTLVQKIVINGESTLFYPGIKVDCALLRGTFCDPLGNISMEREVSHSDALAQAMAVKNCGGIVIVQVESLVGLHEIEPQDVKVPGLLVDYVTVSRPDEHPQTYGIAYNSAFTRPGMVSSSESSISCAERIIAKRALQEIQREDARVINLGIGIPVVVAQVAEELGCAESMSFTIESGVIGGRPATGLSFGASYRPVSIIEQAALFDFYEGGGIDVACLGFAEMDSFGNVNVSRFGSKFQGAGGFINISQSARCIIFCGTFTAVGLVVGVSEGEVRIIREGRINKFVRQVSHLTFNGGYSQSLGQRVVFVTERAVFALKDGVVYLEEIAPGLSIEQDIMPFIEGGFVVSSSCRSMSEDIFSF
ncbi:MULTISPECIES: acyl CoA:acetate/3-ketoacid CoA transferase [unclassified Pseudomonas]|uniref:acyl CoA:acetate/3-ketoacid CoA transferase n=1 Tax=unclassified Pseudomonas TaxID=196821 RepID=UPI00146287D3|nr:MULTISPECIES: CoA-transferase [unclassified Pseudomonas]QJI20619.1 acyl CoA:acetate/3-ketoacid CoA transferase [Pseudomonas sp. ADAK21]QJI24227.1 acyl CoA:acetate/3-ketoacid CoA transferase [Pseudomonas sp. ADAK20]